MYESLLKAIRFINDRHSGEDHSLTLINCIENKGKELAPSKVNFKFGLWMLNYLTVCGYLRVVDISGIGKNRRFFTKDIDYSKVNLGKLYIDLGESISYATLRYHEEENGNAYKSRDMILEKFKSIYLVDKLPRTPRESLDLLNKFFKDSNITANIAIFNDIYEFNRFNKDPKYVNKLATSISKFNNNYVNKDGSIKFSDNLIEKIKSRSINYGDFFRFPDMLIVYDYSKLFESIEFYQGFFDNLMNLEEFVDYSKKLIRKIKSRKNKDIKDYDDVMFMDRTLITDSKLLNSFTEVNRDLINRFQLSIN